MKTLFFFTFLFLNGSFQNTTQKQQEVYICDSPYAKKYHLKENCKGLSECTHIIKKLTKLEANEKGFSICLLEKK